MTKDDILVEAKHHVIMAKHMRCDDHRLIECLLHDK